MLTWHHGFWVYFITRKEKCVWQYVIGAMLPDYIYFITIGIMVMKGQLSIAAVSELNATTMMSLMSLYPWVTKLDLIGHSVVIWGICFILTLLPIVRNIQAFVIGWGTHLFLDGLTHGAYSNYFLYPLSLIAVHSPVSYWEPQYFAHEFKVVNNLIIIITTIYLIYKWWKNKKR